MDWEGEGHGLVRWGRMYDLEKGLGERLEWFSELGFERYYGCYFFGGQSVDYPERGCEI